MATYCLRSFYFFESRGIKKQTKDGNIKLADVSLRQLLIAGMS